MFCGSVLGKKVHIRSFGSFWQKNFGSKIGSFCKKKSRFLDSVRFGSPFSITCITSYTSYRNSFIIKLEIIFFIELIHWNWSHTYGMRWRIVWPMTIPIKILDIDSKIQWDEILIKISSSCKKLLYTFIHITNCVYTLT